MIDSPSAQPTSQPRTFHLSRMGAVALVLSLLMSCSVAVGITFVVNRFRPVTVLPPGQEQWFPSGPDILFSLVASGLGASGGGLLAGVLQQFILHHPSRQQALTTAALWCGAVVTVGICGIPTALALAEVHPVLGMSGFCSIAGGLGASIAWWQIRSITRTRFSTRGWLSLTALA